MRDRAQAFCRPLPRNGERMSVTTIRLPRSLHEQVATLAWKRRLTTNRLMLEVLRAEVERAAAAGELPADMTGQEETHA